MTLTRSNSMPWLGGDRGEEWVRLRLPHFCSRSALLITSSISDTLHTTRHRTEAKPNFMPLDIGGVALQAQCSTALSKQAGTAEGPLQLVKIQMQGQAKLRSLCILTTCEPERLTTDTLTSDKLPLVKGRTHSSTPVIASRQGAPQPSIADQPCQFQAPQQSSIPKSTRCHSHCQHTKAITLISAQHRNPHGLANRTPNFDPVARHRWQVWHSSSSHTKFVDKFMDKFVN